MRDSWVLTPATPSWAAASSNTTAELSAPSNTGLSPLRRAWSFPNGFRRFTTSSWSSSTCTSPRLWRWRSFFSTPTKKTATDVAQARGVIVLAARQAKIPAAYEYTPLQVKQAVVGDGRAVKKQVIEMTKKILCLTKTPEARRRGRCPGHRHLPRPHSAKPH